MIEIYNHVEPEKKKINSNFINYLTMKKIMIVD